MMPIVMLLSVRLSLQQPIMNLSQEHIAILEKGVHRVDPCCTYSVGQQRMWWPPVYYLKWSGLEGGVVGGVVTILHLGEPF